MRTILVLAMLLALASCAQVTCPERGLDGGIGGTGGCTNETTAQEVIAHVSNPSHNPYLPS
ncbi:hypothetical protein A9Q94_00310 [Rhodobacterales bacterium 56_14_T64]|nr:hypothetical protein A9Q94_00310 [Rhodobacterales bacterium 56_14_T64]